MFILVDTKGGSRCLIQTCANRGGLWKCLWYLARGHQASVMNEVVVALGRTLTTCRSLWHRGARCSASGRGQRHGRSLQRMVQWQWGIPPLQQGDQILLLGLPYWSTNLVSCFKLSTNLGSCSKLGLIRCCVVELTSYFLGETPDQGVWEMDLVFVTKSWRSKLQYSPLWPL
jgi:hypothetical protein